jgi:hypothetical protein
MNAIFWDVTFFIVTNVKTSNHTPAAFSSKIQGHGTNAKMIAR